MNLDKSKLNRINIVGTSGSGKSSFGKSLSEILDIEYIEMDRLFWKDDWVMPSDDEFFKTIQKALQKDSWVLDGNYGRTQKIKWNNVETVIWLDFPFHIVFYRVLKRSIQRIMDQKPMWGTNNTESFKMSFLNKDSIIWWMVSTYSRMRKRYHSVFNDDSLEFQRIRLRSPEEAKKFLDLLK